MMSDLIPGRYSTGFLTLAFYLYVSTLIGNANGEKCPESYGYMCVAGNAGKRTSENAVPDKGPLTEYFLSKQHDRKQFPDNNDVFRDEKSSEESSDDVRRGDFDADEGDRYAHLENVDPNGLLYAWLRSLPNNFFDVRTRLRLAYLFKDARSKHDVTRRLLDASRPTRLYRQARHSMGRPRHQARFNAYSGKK